MNRDLYSNSEFTDIKKRLNQEIQRRGTYSWWDPLTFPEVGENRSLPLTLPDIGIRIPVTDKTYTINTPSDGSIERTKNIPYPTRGDNPGGGESTTENNIPDNSAAKFSADEMRNFLVGLSKIQDINLFYGRDEIERLAFRDPQGIMDVLEAAEHDINTLPREESDLPIERTDPNQGITYARSQQWPAEDFMISYHQEDGKWVMPSGERDGEEVHDNGSLGPNNFFDDYGAQKGDGDYHPFNPGSTPLTERRQKNDPMHRDIVTDVFIQGGIPSSTYGANPRNPNPGNDYKSRRAFGGKSGSCNVACTGLCYRTCDNECSESCHATCWNRCGEACTASCGNVCTGCSTMCYSSCKTKCENIGGYACMKAGVQAVNIYTTGGYNGEYAANHLDVSMRNNSCDGCTYSCEFYPNKKTTCWDAACMGMCYISCSTACSTTCFGGCIDNDRENKGAYKIGKGRGCSAGCTMNCIGACKGVCEYMCTQTCFHACKQLCSDNCSWRCFTACGSGCQTGCTESCNTTCMRHAGPEDTACTDGDCSSTCEHGCNHNCLGWGCRSLCGTDSAGACEHNCRINCSSTSCTALCSDACSGECTTCVNSCGWQCGPCSSLCSTGCEAECNITCSSTCAHSCEINCVHDCTDQCGGCSDLCYSCVGMCIGVCSVKCEQGCSNCTLNCTYWCDLQCSQHCLSTCDDRCISNCSGSCATYLMSETTDTIGPEKDPTAEGYVYPHPKNRWEERESFIIHSNPAPVIDPNPEPEPVYRAYVGFRKDHTFDIVLPEGMEYHVYATPVVSGIYTIDRQTGEISIVDEVIDHISTQFGIWGRPDDGVRSKLESYMWPEDYDPDKFPMQGNPDGSGAMYIIVLHRNDEDPLTVEDIEIDMPFGFEQLPVIVNEANGDIIIMFQRHYWKLQHELEAEQNEQNNQSSVSGD